MQEDFSYDKEDEEFFAELEQAEQKLDAIFSHMDELSSWHDFLIFEHDNLLKLEQNLDAISLQANKVVLENAEEKQFLIGVFWVGAISAYEGAMHELFIHSLQVGELRERIRSVCERRIKEKKPPHKDMKDSDIESIREWLKGRVISSPAKAAERFDLFYDIQTVRPDVSWCEQILDIRNAYAHRNGGGIVIDEDQLYQMINELKKFANCFYEAFANQVEKILAKEI